MRLLFSLLYLTGIAQSGSVTLPDLTVFSGKKTPAAEELFAPSVVTGERWEEAGGTLETGLLSVPGLAFSAAGGIGQTRSLFLRGAKAEHTLVLVDGLPVNDPLSPARAFDFGLLPVSNIDRIEILKGPQSVLFGSDALGGVVQIFTRGKEAPPRLGIELGAFRTLRLRASAAGFAAGYTQSHGFSAADEQEGNTEADGHRAAHISFGEAVSLGTRTNLRTQAFLSETKTDTDRSGGRGGDSYGTFTRNFQLGGRAELSRVNSSGWESSLAASAFRRTRFDTTATAAGDSYRSLSWRLDGVLRRERGGALPTLGFSFTEEKGASTQLTRRGSLRSGALFAQYERRLGRAFFLAGGRADLYQRYGSALTYRAGGGYWLIPGTFSVRANYGTGFKAPSLYQIFSIYGGPALRPEKSKGAELGFSWEGAAARAELTLFETRFSELIDFAPNPAPGYFYNMGRARTSGAELAFELPIGPLRLENAITMLRTRDEATGARLLRRPSFTYQARLGYQAASWGSAVTARWVSRRDDLDPISYTRQSMASFFTAGLSGQYLWSANWKLTARVENLLNRRYQETRGFGTSPISVYLGAEAEL